VAAALARRTPRQSPDFGTVLGVSLPGFDSPVWLRDTELGERPADVGDVGWLLMSVGGPDESSPLHAPVASNAAAHAIAAHPRNARLMVFSPRSARLTRLATHDTQHSGS
jgi:hypothetical protein